MADDVTFGVAKIPVVLDFTEMDQTADADLRRRATAHGERLAAAVRAAAMKGLAVAGKAATAEMATAMTHGAADTGREVAGAVGGALTPALERVAEHAGERAGAALTEAAKEGGAEAGAQLARETERALAAREDELARKAREVGDHLGRELGKGLGGGDGTAPAPAPSTPTPAAPKGNAASALLERLNRNFDFRTGRNDLALSAGQIDVKEWEKRGRAAGERFDAGLRAGIERLRREGILSTSDFNRLANSFRTVGHRAGEALNEGVREGSSSGMGSLMLWLKATLFTQIAQLAGQILGWVKAGAAASIQAFTEADASGRRLAATAKLFSISYAEMSKVARMGRDELGLTRAMADGLAGAASKLAARAGEVGKSGEFMTRWLDLAAANGIDANDALEALNTTLIGQDEGLNKLGLANPSGIWKDWADAAGTTVAKMTDQQKWQAILNTVTEQGAKVQGTYRASLTGSLGEMRAWDRMVVTAKENVGARLVPVVADAARALSGPFSGGIGIVNRMLEGLMSPLDRAIVKMRELGLAAEHTLPSLIRAQQLEDRKAQQDLRGEIRDIRAGGGGAWGRFVRGLGLSTQSGGWVGEIQKADDASLRAWQQRLEAERRELLRNPDLDKQRRDAQFRRDLAARNRAPGAGGENRNSVLMGDMTSGEVEERLKLIEALVTRQTELTTTTRRLAQSETEYTRALHDSDIQAKIDLNNDRIAVIDATAQATEALKRERAALVAKNEDLEKQKSTYHAPEPVKPTTSTESEAARKKREAAALALREQADDLDVVAKFHNVAGRSYTMLDQMPAKLRTAVAEVIDYQKKVRDLEDRIRDAGGSAPAAITRQIEGYKREQARALADAQRIAADPANLVDDRLREARDHVHEITAEWRSLSALGFTSLRDVPQQFVAAAGEATQLAAKIKEVQATIQEMEAAGEEAPAAAKRLLEAYTNQAREAAKEAQRLIPLRNILKDFPTVTSEMFRGMKADQIEVVTQALLTLDKATRRVTDAETALTAARISHDPHRIADAEHEVEAARRGVTRVTQDLEDRLRRAGLQGEQLRRVLQIIGGEGPESADPPMEKWQRWVAAINAAVEGVLALGEALGGLDSQTEKGLKGLQELAEGAANIAKAIASHGKEAASGIAGLVQVVTGAIHIGQALFGTSDEEKKLNEIQSKENVELINALREVRDALLSTISTDQARADAAMAEKAAGILGRDKNTHEDGNDLRRREALRDLAVSLGLSSASDKKEVSIDALRRWAEELDQRYNTGGVLARAVENSDPETLLKMLQGLPDAIREAASKFGQFGDDVAGVLARITWEFNTLKKTDAAELTRAKVHALQEAGKSLGEFADEFAALSALDLSTEEGRHARDEIIAQMVARIAGGGADFGALTPDQLRALVEEWSALTGEKGGVTGGAADEPARTNISMTEVQGSQIASGIATLVEEARKIRAAEEQMLALQLAAYPNRELPSITAAADGTPLVASLALPSFTAPSPASLGLAPAPSYTGGDVYQVEITVENVTVGGGAPGDVGAWRRAGEEIADGIADGLAAPERDLGARMRAAGQRRGVRVEMAPRRS